MLWLALGYDTAQGDAPHVWGQNQLAWQEGSMRSPLRSWADSLFCLVPGAEDYTWVSVQPMPGGSLPSRPASRLCYLGLTAELGYIILLLIIISPVLNHLSCSLMQTGPGCLEVPESREGVAVWGLCPSCPLPSHLA